MDHVVPPNSEVLSQAIRRRLVSTPPSHMIGGDRESLRVNAWIRSGRNSGLYVRPRLFMPYYEEVKVRAYESISQVVQIACFRPEFPSLWAMSHLSYVDEKVLIL